MRIRYIIPFRRDLVIPDHWGIPFMGGICRVIEKDGRAKSLEITFAGQPVSLAPTVVKHSEGQVKLTITEHDHQKFFVKKYLEDAMAYVQCFHDLDLATDEIEVNYEEETPEEADQIWVKRKSLGKFRPPLFLSFDMITRAIMAAETARGPTFVSTLASTARKALIEQQFINSFRYSFLLIESIFGGGKFKSNDLKEKLKNNRDFKAIVGEALKDIFFPRDRHTSDTLTLLSKNPTIDAVIDHLVEKRGFYFHGNVKRKDAWRPDDQSKAATLAHFAITIVHSIAREAIAPIFVPEFEKRHFEDAMKVGAKIVFQIKAKYQMPGESFQRDMQTAIRTPGTKVTSMIAFGVAQRFFLQFQEKLPTAALDSAECTVEGTSEKVFDIHFYIGGDRN